MSKNKKNKEIDLASEYIFLSYSGLQGLSILGPILSLLNTGIKLAKCGIFCTEKAKPHALRVIEFLKSYKTIDFEIEIVDVEDDNSSIDVVSNWLDNNYIDNRKSILSQPKKSTLFTEYLSFSTIFASKLQFQVVHVSGNRSLLVQKVH